MPIKFNVRDYASNAKTTDVYIQRNFDQINLLVFLFDGLDFRTIFEAKMVDLLKGLVAKVAEARDVYLLRMREWAIIDAAVKKILALVPSGHPLFDKTVEDYFIEDLTQGNEGVFALFEEIEVAGVDLPFLHQDAAQKAMAKEKVFDANPNYLYGSLLNDDTDPAKRGIGNLTEYDLYTRRHIDYPSIPGQRDLWQIIQTAKTAGVLQGQVPGGTNKLTAAGVAVTASKINDMACLDNVCVSCVGYYCVMIEGPAGCSLESDPYP